VNFRVGLEEISIFNYKDKQGENVL